MKKKCLGINLRSWKKFENLKIENYRTLKEINKETTSRIFHVHCSEELILLKGPNYPKIKISIDSMQSLLNFPMRYFTEILKIILMFVWNHR